MTKQEAYINIQSLIDKYHRLSDLGKVKTYNEAQTVNEFILPLFYFLGWDIHNIHAEEVTPEERISKGRVDWAFRLDGIPKFFLEAKALKVDLDDFKWAEQAISYSWNKGVTWAVLTDFEAIKVFNADVSTSSIRESLFFELRVDEYLDRFEQLWLLSKEAFKAGLLDKEAEKWGKKVKRKAVGVKLFEDLMKWRLILTKAFHKANTLNQEELDEGVQRILDRLIFIRTAEDRGIEPNVLLTLLRQHDFKKPLIKRLNTVFRDFDDGYNSKLFEPHYSETWQIDDAILKSVIDGLYNSEGYRYDFSAISADVLGGIYEQYLGHILKQAKKRASVQKEHQRRKEQGIYYTPQFIVDYIVKNTLGRFLKQKPYRDIMDIKILDMACGSGSFLIRAYEELIDYFERKDRQPNLFTNFRILTANIYGVDLDAQAVEIAQLNLLLKSLKMRAKLPNLANKIRVGNSLISGSEDELQRYFSERYQNKRPFSFEQQFPEVFDRKNPGFDVIIGNPPYVRIQTLPKDEVKYYSEKYESASGNYDVYVLFVERAMQLLRDGGLLGFILPKKFFTATYGEGLRDLLSRQNTLYEIVDFAHEQVFEGATTYTCLLFLRKAHNKDFRYVECKNIANAKNTKTLDLALTDWQRIDNHTISAKPWYFTNELESSLIGTLETLHRLESIASNIFVGLQTSADSVYILNYINTEGTLLHLHSKSLKRDVLLESHFMKPLISGVDVKRYSLPKKRQYILFPYKIIDGTAQLVEEPELKQSAPLTYSYLKENEKILKSREGGKFNDKNWYRFGRTQNIGIQEQPKICVPRLVSRIQAYFDERGEFYLDNVDVGGLTLQDSTRTHYLYILALLNSSLLSYYLTKISTPFRGNFYSCNKQYLSQLPIKLLDLTKPDEKRMHDEVVSLVERILRLHNELAHTSQNTDKWYEIKKQIEQTDRLIDERVFEIYGVSDTKQVIQTV